MPIGDPIKFSIVLTSVRLPNVRLAGALAGSIVYAALVDLLDGSTVLGISEASPALSLVFFPARIAASVADKLNNST